ncbi:MAG: hypothetical protein J6Y70_01725 [Bacilli bacterium]|nr:hypothetical protein [Bacilli bacterium]
MSSLFFIQDIINIHEKIKKCMLKKQEDINKSKNNVRTQTNNDLNNDEKIILITIFQNFKHLIFVMIKHLIFVMIKIIIFIIVMGALNSILRIYLDATSETIESALEIPIFGYLIKVVAENIQIIDAISIENIFLYIFGLILKK